MSVDETVTLILSVAGALGLRELVPGAIRYLTGRASRVKQDLRDADAKVDAAEARADAADAARRVAVEHAWHLRGLMLEWGIPHGELPSRSAAAV